MVIFFFFLIYEIQDQFSPRQKQRFRVALRDYLEGSAEENFIRNGDVSLDEYIRIRRKANGSGQSFTVDALISNF